MKALVSKFLKVPFLDKRTFNNILSILVLRGGNIALQLLLVPLSIRFVSSSSYGLWLTLSSMVTWLNVMDIGLSNGLRNKMTEANAKENFALSKSYVSTTYCMLAIISVVGFAICLLLIYFLNWHTIVDVPANMPSTTFRLILMVIGSSFFLTFLLKPIASIAYATHKAYIEFLILFLANLINFVVIWLLSKLVPAGNILLLSLCFCFTPIIVTFFLTVYFFRTHFKLFSPSIRTIDFAHARELMSLSGKFFIIQIAATVIFTTNNFLISHFFGNEDVTKFNIVQRYFNIVITLQGMVLVPFWTIFTEEFAKRNAHNLESNMRKLLNMTAAMAAGSVLMALLSRFAYHLWIGDLVQIPFSLTLIVCFYSILLLYSTVFTTFINGTGRIRLQMRTSLLSSTLHIPLAILLIKYFNVGILGLILLSCFWLGATIPLRYIQYKKLSSLKEEGLLDEEKSIWTR